MATQYHVTINQAKVLRAFGQASELSTREIAVYARLMPDEVGEAVAALQQMGLVTTWFPVTGLSGDQLVSLRGDGSAVASALAQYQSVPAVGTVVPLPTSSIFSPWLSFGRIAGSGTAHVLVEPDKK